MGATVTINGSGFTGATAVRFNGVAANGFVLISDTKMTAVVPVGVSTGPINVVTPAGTAVTANFTVTPGVKLLKDGLARPGGMLTLNAVGFDAFEAVDIFIDLTDVRLASVSAQGTVSQQFKVPFGTASGPHVVILLGRKSGRSAQETIDVETSWPGFSFSPTGNNVNPYEKTLASDNVVDMELSWARGLDTFGNEKPLIEVNGSVFVTTHEGKVSAFSSSGQPLWSAQMPTASVINAIPPVSGAGKLFTFDPTNRKVVAYSLRCRSDGGICTPLWTSAALPGAAGISAPPTYYKSTIYVPATDGKIYPVNPTTGSIGTGLFALGPTYGYIGRIETPVAFDASGRVQYISVENDGNRILQVADQLVSTAPLAGASSSVLGTDVVSTPVNSAGGAFVVLNSGAVAYYGAGGWRTQIQATSCGSAVPAPVVAAGYVFAACGTTLASLNKTTGTVYWSRTLASNTYGLTFANGLLYVCSSNQIQIYSMYGTALWSGGTCQRNIIVANGRLYTSMVKVFTFEPRSSVPDLNAKRRPPQIRPSDLKPDYTLTLASTAP